MTALRSLERFARRSRPNADVERCELCSEAVGPSHRHVVDRADRRILCVCTACGFAFDGADMRGRFAMVPETVRSDPSTSIDTAALQAAGVPVGLAFFRPSSTGQRIVVFPSPAGGTEAELTDAAWRAIEEKCPLVRKLDDDVEALLVRSERSGRATVLAVPIDVCYELVALIRRKWKGIDGGDEMHGALDAFFDALVSRARSEVAS